MTLPALPHAARAAPAVLRTGTITGIRAHGDGSAHARPNRAVRLPDMSPEEAMVVHVSLRETGGCTDRTDLLAHLGSAVLADASSFRATRFSVDLKA